VNLFGIDMAASLRILGFPAMFFGPKGILDANI
jgi:hypothetical protein